MTLYDALKENSIRANQVFEWLAKHYDFELVGKYDVDTEVVSYYLVDLYTAEYLSQFYPVFVFDEMAYFVGITHYGISYSDIVLEF